MIVSRFCPFSLISMLMLLVLLVVSLVFLADDADRSVVLVLLQVVFLGKRDDQGLGPRGWSFSCLPDLVANCRDSSDCFFSTCFDSSAGMLSTPADFPFFNNCTAASTSL